MHATAGLSLAGWLQHLDRPPLGVHDELLLGGSGHLLLTPAEEDNIASQLRDGVLPQLFQNTQARPVCVLTGLAPGADLLFTQIVSDWLREAGIACRTIGLLPLPVPLLLEDWVLVAEASGRVDAAAIERQRERLTRTLDTCSSVIDLMPAVNAEKLRSANFRQSQYRRLAACLAQRSDILVAILRSENPARPGGTAEVVDWRRNPQKVPPQYSTLTLSADGVQNKRRLILIDPESLSSGADVAPATVPITAQSFAARAYAAMQAGNYVHCYDLAQQARARGLDSSRLQYLSLLALVNAGSTALAWRRYNELGLHGDERDEDWLALKGRLLKDLALKGLSIELPSATHDDAPHRIEENLPIETGDQAAHGFYRAAQAYLAAYRLTGGHFTAINAATLFQLAGDSTRAHQLALDVLAQLADADPAGGSEIERYYRHVTEAEAALLVGDLARYRRSLAHADPLMRGNFNARSRTRAQLRLLCTALRLDEELLTLLWLPEVIRVYRRAEAAANAAIDGDFRGSLVFIVLDRVADLDAAEQLLKRGAHLHIVLPGERGAMLAQWHERFGSNASQRLEALLEAAGDVTVARGFLERETQWSQSYVGAVADGLAELDAARLGCRVRELFVDRADAVPAHRAKVRPAPLPDRADDLGERRFAGLIFADIVNFSRLHDDELPRFWDVVMGGIARIIDSFGARVLFRSTWGDALLLITEDALTAAEIAIAIQARFEQLRTSESGGLANIELRLAAHFGPVFAGHDPIVQGRVFYGSQLAFTARIEPITPPGIIFVTELLAARLMLDAAQAFHLEYVGELALAKHYGSYRIFSLRAADRQPAESIDHTRIQAVSSDG